MKMQQINWIEITVGGFVGMVLQYLVVVIVRWWESRRGEWHGVWYEVVPSHDGLPERWDKIRFSQRGNRITGAAERYIPVTENRRRWKYEGYVSGDRMVGFYYITDPKIDVSSYG